MTLKRLIMLLLIIGSCATEMYVTKDQYTHFSRLSQGFVLNGEKLLHTKAVSLLHCCTECVVRPECNGLNFQKRITRGQYRTSCEIIHLSESFSSPEQLTEKAGWSSYKLDTRNTRYHSSKTLCYRQTGLRTSVKRLTTQLVISPSTVSLSGDTSTTLTKLTTESALVPQAETNSDAKTTAIQTTLQSYMDLNPEFCSIDAGLVYSDQVYLISGESVYTFPDMNYLSLGPVKTEALSIVFPGISAPVDAIYMDGTELHVVKDGVVYTYSGPLQGFSWEYKKTETENIFFGKSYGGISAVSNYDGEIIIILGSKATKLGESKLCNIKSNCNGNVLMAYNKNDSPRDVTAACAISSQTLLVFEVNQCHSYTKNQGDSKGTWTNLGKVKCR